MTDRQLHPTSGPVPEVPRAPDADAEPTVDSIPLPGAAGPVGGSPTGEVVDGINQPIDLPGDRPVLSTD